MSKRWIRHGVTGLMALVILTGWTIGVRGAEAIQGQKQVMIVDDAFQFIKGSWADYTIRDKAKKESYHFVLSILGDERVEGKDCSWMEIKVEMKNKPVVVTRVLVEKTPKGPGDALKAIVQIAGFDPFTVPGKYLKGNGSQDTKVAPTRQYHLTERLNEHKMIFKGREISVWKVRAKGLDEKFITAYVSNEIPPLGLYKVELANLGMYLNDWGMGAKSEIEGAPMNFYLWIAKQIGQAIAEGTSDKKK